MASADQSLIQSPSNIFDVGGKAVKYLWQAVRQPTQISHCFNLFQISLILSGKAASAAWLLIQSLSNIFDNRA